MAVISLADYAQKKAERKEGRGVLGDDTGSQNKEEQAHSSSEDESNGVNELERLVEENRKKKRDLAKLRSKQNKKLVHDMKKDKRGR